MSILDLLYVGALPTALLLGMLWNRVYLTSTVDQLVVFGVGLLGLIVAVLMIGLLNWGNEGAFWSAVLFREWSVGQFMMVSGGVLMAYAVGCFILRRCGVGTRPSELDTKN